MCAKKVDKALRGSGNHRPPWTASKSTTTRCRAGGCGSSTRTIDWALDTIAYPAWPLIQGATQGYLGQNTRADVAARDQVDSTMRTPRSRQSWLAQT